MQILKQITFTNSRFPKMLAELMHSNQFLKVFTVSLLAILFVTVGIVGVLATKEPVIITLSHEAKSLEQIVLPKLEDQIKEGLKQYLQKRYHWEPDNVRKQLKEAEEYISPKQLKSFQSASFGIEKFSREKIVSQRIYPEEIKVNSESKTALITGDRITSIQNLRAAGLLNIQLSYEYGERTKRNPWGIYITKEKEE